MVISGSSPELDRNWSVFSFRECYVQVGCNFGNPLHEYFLCIVRNLMIRLLYKNIFMYNLFALLFRHYEDRNSSVNFLHICVWGWYFLKWLVYFNPWILTSFSRTCRSRLWRHLRSCHPHHHLRLQPLRLWWLWRPQPRYPSRQPQVGRQPRPERDQDLGDGRGVQVCDRQSKEN